MLTGHADTVGSLLFDHDGEVLLSGDYGGSIIQWDLEEMKVIDAPVKGFGDSISSIFLAPDGHVKALALEKNRVILLKVNENPPLGRRIRAPDIGSANVAFSRTAVSWLRGRVWRCTDLGCCEWPTKR